MCGAERRGKKNRWQNVIFSLKGFCFYTKCGSFFLSNVSIYPESYFCIAAIQFKTLCICMCVCVARHRIFMHDMRAVQHIRHTQRMITARSEK